MIFSSYSFLGFLAIVFAGYYTLNRFGKQSLSKYWLVLSSFYFYAQGSSSFLPFFIFTVFFNYLIGTTIIRQKTQGMKKLFFAIGLLDRKSVV